MSLDRMGMELVVCLGKVIFHDQGMNQPVENQGVRRTTAEEEDVVMMTIVLSTTQMTPNAVVGVPGPAFKKVVAAAK
jgi:hypothetical protein